VLEALVRLHFTRTFRATRRRLSAVVRHYVEQNASAIRRKPHRHRHRHVNPTGLYVDLAEIFAEMNRQYFGGRVRAAITWSRAVNRRQMGSCHDGRTSGEPMIVINRLFDDPEVPRHYLDFLVVHEMLHCVFPRRTHNGRTVRHSRELREFERRLPFYRQATEWEKREVERLYRRRKRGRLAQMLLPFGW
jgi:predicted metal-dependent hydrolase